MHGPDHGRAEDQEFGVGVRGFAGIKERAELRIADGVIDVLARAVDARKGLFVQQALEPVALGNVAQGGHDDVVMIHRQVAHLVEGRDFVLAGGHLVVAGAHGHGQLVQLPLHFHHIGQHALRNDAEILVAEFLPLGRTRAEQGAPRDLKVGTGKIEVVIDAEVFLLQTGKGHDGQRRLNAEELEHALCLTVQSLTGTQQRRFLVQRNARPRQEHGGDAQERAVGVFHDIGGARHIPGRIAASLEGGAQTAGGEGGSVRLAPDKHGTGKFRNDAAGGVGRKEAVVLLGGLAGQRIENMGEVRRALFNGPVLHNRRHGIRNGRVHAFAEGDGLVQGLVHGLGQTLAHHLVVEDIAAEKVRGLGFRKIERRGIGLVGRNGLNGMLPGDIAAHESLVWLYSEQEKKTARRAVFMHHLRRPPLSVRRRCRPEGGLPRGRRSCVGV